MMRNRRCIGGGARSARWAVLTALTVLASCSTPARESVELPSPTAAPAAEEVEGAAAAVEVVALDPTPRSVLDVPTSAPTVPRPEPRDNDSRAPVAVSPGPARPAPVRSPSAGERVRIDAMVGQINGRPLYASSFFQTMDARLRAEAERRSPEDWLAYARDEIRRALRDRIRDELLLAEVESSLTPAQRAGVVTFVRSLRDGLVSENRGSEALADRRLIEEQGITLEEAVEARKNEELIRSWLRRILQNQVYVPFRDVRLRYERDRDVYNPPARAVLRMIRAPADDTERVTAIADAIAADESFESVARRLGLFSPDTGGLLERVLDGPYEQAALIGIPDLNTAAQRLTPGGVAGPIDVGSNIYWIHLESVIAASRSLYETQIQIQDQLFSERVRAAEEEYFLRLVERSGMGAGEEIMRMESRLFEIAAERYLLSQRR